MLDIWFSSPRPFFSNFRIAIWERNIFVSSLVMGTWLGNLGLNIYGKFVLGIPQLCAHPGLPRLRRFDQGGCIWHKSFRWIFLTSARKITAESAVRSNSRHVQLGGFAQGPGQRCLHASSRCSAHHEHANWTPAIFAP